MHLWTPVEHLSAALWHSHDMICGTMRQHTMGQHTMGQHVHACMHACTPSPSRGVTSVELTGVASGSLPTSLPSPCVRPKDVNAPMMLTASLDSACQGGERVHGGWSCSTQYHGRTRARRQSRQVGSRAGGVKGH